MRVWTGHLADVYIPPVRECMIEEGYYGILFRKPRSALPKVLKTPSWSMLKSAA
jgi:hypothetical protein